jgi:hypothetical protein
MIGVAVASTDVSGVALLAVFVRACDRDLNVTEELLHIISLRNTTRGEDIFEEACRLLGEYDPSLSKLLCVCACV